MRVRRILGVAGLLASGYLVLAFGRPYYQYLMLRQAFDDAMDAGIVRIPRSFGPTPAWT